MHQISFPAVRDCLECLSPDARMSADELIMQNIPCCKGCHYVFVIVDHATKMCWVLLLKTRESIYILAHFTTFVNKVLLSLNNRLRQFHSDGGAELVAGAVFGFLHKSGVTTLQLPRDITQMNSCCCVPPCLLNSGGLLVTVSYIC